VQPRVPETLPRGHRLERIKAKTSQRLSAARAGQGTACGVCSGASSVARSHLLESLGGLRGDHARARAGNNVGRGVTRVERDGRWVQDARCARKRSVRGRASAGAWQGSAPPSLVPPERHRSRRTRDASDETLRPGSGQTCNPGRREGRRGRREQEGKRRGEGERAAGRARRQHAGIRLSTNRREGQTVLWREACASYAGNVTSCS